MEFSQSKCDDSIECFSNIFNHSFTLSNDSECGGNYHVECLTAKTFLGAIEITRDYFCQDETVCIGAELDKDPKAAEELLEQCADAALDGVSLVVVENRTGEVVCVSFNKLQVPPSDSSEKTYFDEVIMGRWKQAASRSTMEFLINVGSRCNLFEKYNADCSLELIYLSTHKDHRRKGLAELVVKDSIELAKKLRHGPVTTITVKDLGPKYAHLKDRPVTKKPPKICQAMFTSFISQKIGLKLGFNVEAKIPFEEFLFNGKTYAERIGPSSTHTELNCIVIN